MTPSTMWLGEVGACLPLPPLLRRRGGGGRRRTTSGGCTHGGERHLARWGVPIRPRPRGWGDVCCTQNLFCTIRPTAAVGGERHTEEGGWSNAVCMSRGWRVCLVHRCGVFPIAGSAVQAVETSDGVRHLAAALTPPPPPPSRDCGENARVGRGMQCDGGGWGGGAPPAAAADAWGRPCHPRCGCASATLPAVCGRGRGRVCPRLLWRGRLCPRLLWRGRLGGATPCVRRPAAGGGVREGVGSHPRGGATRVLTTRPT